MDENIEMFPFYNKHYVKTDDNGVVIDAFSDGPLYNKSTDGYICFNAEGSYQLRLKFKDEEDNIVFSEENAPITNWNGIYIYKFVDGFFVKRTEEEMKPDYEAMLPSLDSVKNEKQKMNKVALAEFLKNNPITFNGELFGVTEDDQNEMSLNYMQYQIAKIANVPAKLEWHSVKQACRTFEEAEYIQLTIAITNFVYPYLRQQESIKTAIYACTTRDEVAAIEIKYEIPTIKTKSRK